MAKSSPANPGLFGRQLTGSAAPAARSDRLGWARRGPEQPFKETWLRTGITAADARRQLHGRTADRGRGFPTLDRKVGHRAVLALEAAEHASVPAVRVLPDLQLALFVH